MSATAFGLGSNLGDRLGSLRTALGMLRERFVVLQTSDVFETAPWGVPDQPYFLNACVLAECNVAPERLLEEVKQIERSMGRTPSRRWGERSIDVDILLMDGLCLATPTLTIPHAEMCARDFVLVPLAQILPDWVHPIANKTAAALAAEVQGARGVGAPPLRICRL
ncbi:MAG: 2-amino-4-hydroxy-6-hydroxymethyldihydropteridine diphosphokinase [Synergistaceae bacterium]|jgi:2-amino-4-hydroxy-6-hydroxymethyldihydropteridine diphosphokinase|nr:2-amino-4-hydroxy-6-hydroxymethyldihydropteridine diphosphokinase [Synergistaceae bacterium]